MEKEQVSAPSRQRPSAASCLRQLKDTSSRILGVCRKEVAEIKSSGKPWDAEYVYLVHFEQMAAIGAAIVCLAENRETFGDTCPPSSVLGRTINEGLIYLNFMLREKSEERASWFLVCETFWRESYIDRQEGKVWRRFHGKSSGKKENCSKVFITLKVEQWEEEACDEFEKQRILRDVKDLADLSIQNRHAQKRKSLPPSASVTKWREYWNDLGSKLKDRVRDQWKKSNKRWNLMCKWPFGLPPKNAIQEGSLLDEIDRIVKDDCPRGTVRTDLMKEGLTAVGLDIMSDLTHFSPTRVVIGRAGFEGITIATAIYVLSVATRLLSEHYEWAKQLWGGK